MDLRRSRFLLVLAASVLFGLYFWYFSALGKAEPIEMPGDYEAVPVPSLVVTPIADALIGKEYRFERRLGDVHPHTVARIVEEDGQLYEQTLRFQHAISVHPLHTTLIFEEVERSSTDQRRETFLWIDLELSFPFDPTNAPIDSREMEASFGGASFRGELELFEEISFADVDGPRLLYRGRLFHRGDHGF